VLVKRLDASELARHDVLVAVAFHACRDKEVDGPIRIAEQVAVLFAIWRRVAFSMPPTRPADPQMG
jgi:hypothetical protein